MKRTNNLLEKAADPDNLRLAFWKAKRGKNRADNVEIFRRSLDQNLLLLREQLLTGQVDVGNYHFFKIYDPKERQICASAFSEQVLHHALMNVAHDDFDRVQIFDSYACRKGKGSHAALERAKGFAKRFDWFLKLDVRKFFDSVHHEVLKTQLSRIFKDAQLLAILGQIIDSYAASPQRGLPIGNLTSQYFANHYLSALDHLIKEHLGIKGYVRYMDDFVLWSNDRAELKAARLFIQQYTEKTLRCELKPTLLNRSRAGLPFLGYLVFPQKVRLAQRSKRRFIRKFRQLEEKFHSGEWSEAVCQRRALPLLAFTQYADAKAFRHKILQNEYGRRRKGAHRVQRGGSWNNNPQNCRSAYRNHNEPDNRNNNIGFRLVGPFQLTGKPDGFH